MTLCIAAECWHEEKPCIAMCCDTRAERGGLFHELVGSDDVEKIRQIGPITALLSGSETAADELLTLCDRPIRNFSRTPPSPMDSDEAVTAFLKELRAQAADRKKDLLDHHLRMSLGLSFDEFLNTHRDRLHDVHSRDIWNQIHHIDLETDLLICGFSGDEPVVIRLDRFGKTHWETNYSVVGIGSDIALAFLCQRDWSAKDGSPLQLTDCLLRIYEAKRAAEKNRHVGEATSFEILFRNGERFDISDSCFRMMKIVLDITYRKMPFQEGYLEKEAEHKPIPIEQRKKNAPTE